uniref:Uncharacterized protein n=1 Tax=Acrobeloides nanus TaxID=290746 RepID=A0A914DFE3_9BILA
MTVEGFDRLKKAYNLDCKFEDFPKLVAHVIDSLEVTKKNFVHVHIVEDYCSVNFVKSDEWHFMLNFKVISSDVVGYLLEVVQNLQIRVDQEDLQMQNLQKQMEQTQILSHEKSSPVQVNPEMSPTRSEIGSNNMRNSFNGQCVETDQNQ